MKTLYRILGSAMLALLVVACGGGGGGGGGGSVAGIGGTGRIASGTITGFGSIFVNGVEYEIDSASCEVDGVDETGNCQANLRLGMVVTVTATVIGNNGVASRVVFDDDVEGPVSNLLSDADGLTKSFSVLGVDVVVDKTGTAFDDSTVGFNFDGIADNDSVEVSGYFDAAGILHASFIEKKGTLALGSTEVELGGTVSGAPTGGAGVSDTFIVNGVTVTILAATDLGDMPGGLVSNGNLVEVKGVLTDTSSIDASKVELTSSEIGAEGDDISIQGLVSGFNGDLGNFFVAGQSVNASAAIISPVGLQLVNGMTVEVEGRQTSGVLVATKLEARGNDIRIEAPVSSVTENTVTLLLGDGSVSAGINNKTSLEDETGMVTNMKPSDISTGDFLEIRGFMDNGGIVASEIRRDKADDAILQGPVDSTVNGSSVTILGVSFLVDAATQYEDLNDAPVSSASFFATDRTGNIVKIKDREPGDGTADEVDLED